MRNIVAATVLGLLTVSSATTSHAQSAAFQSTTIRRSQHAGTARIILDDGHFRATNVTLLMLVDAAYRQQLAGAQLLDGPEWMDVQRFDVEADAPGLAASQELPVMIQRLLIERFNLMLHLEQRELPAYALTFNSAASGSLKVSSDLPPADSVVSSSSPDGTVDCKRLLPLRVGSSGGNRPCMNDSAPLGGRIRLVAVDSSGVRQLTARSVTMQEVADQLSVVMNTHVIDRTAASGRYDFDATLRDASDLLGVLREQAGLELQLIVRTPFEAVVIDHVSQPSLDELEPPATTVLQRVF